jgi:hypothetical protein
MYVFVALEGLFFRGLTGVVISLADGRLRAVAFPPYWSAARGPGRLHGRAGRSGYPPGRADGQYLKTLLT